jgi:epoxyqueuosine reductase
MVTEVLKERFRANPSLFLEEEIKKHVSLSTDNCLTSFNNVPIWDEPLIGFANGDDPIFQDYRRIIGDFHLTPREALAKHPQLMGDSVSGRRPRNVSVISWILPSTYETRLSLRKESVVPSLRWNHTRWQGQNFISELSRYLVSLLERLGHHAVTPELLDSYQIRDSANGLVSNWSQRHIAYAAGLGTFSLSDGFITPKGVAIRVGSVVCDADLTPTPRVYENHLANCLFHRGGSCWRCIERCPADAISEQGHDKNRCRQFLLNEQKAILKELRREEGYIGRYPGCGLCQTKVPCEDRIPSLILPGNGQQG